MFDSTQPSSRGSRKVWSLIHDQAGHELLMMTAIDAKLFMDVKLVSVVGSNHLCEVNDGARVRCGFIERKRQIIGVARVCSVESARQRVKPGIHLKIDNVREP